MTNMNTSPAQGQSTGSSQAATQALLGLLQMGKRARAAQSLSELGFMMVNETLQLLNYRQAALWQTAGLGHVSALSGTPQVDANAPYTQWLSQLLRHLVKTEAQQETPQAAQLIDLTQLPEYLAEDWSNWLPAQAMWLPFYAQNNVIGGLLLVRTEAWSPGEQALAAEIGQVYQHAFSALSPSRHWQLNLRDKLKPTKAKVWTLAVLAVILLFPVRLSVLAPAEVAPRDPFLVRAPLDGVVENLYVHPNQAVSAQTPLFSLDTTTLQSQHAVAQQAYDTAQEEYRQAAQLAVTDDKSKLDMAMKRGALAEKSVELSYASDQLGRVQVKAERAGVAVFNDVNDWQGKAVMLGEKILLLADPDKVELSIDLPASDIIALAPGAEVVLYPNVSPVASYTAAVTNIAYHAEPTPNGVLAYRIKAELSPNQSLPRLGMMGTAKISGNRVPFCYYLLRKPLAAARQWLGW